MRKTIRYGLYPLSLVSVLATIVITVQRGGAYGTVYGITTLALIVVLILTETAFPLKPGWRMTGRSAWRDIRYILIDAPVVVLTNMGFGWLAIVYSERFHGWLGGTPVWLSVLGYLIVFEFFQYWYHRLSHEGRGRLGRFFWRAHIAHHLPDRVYVLMHAVFHPVNGALATMIIQAPLVVLGISPAAAFAATLLIGFQGLVSHFNVDIRAGWLNYVFIGTETHRCHHSASREEAQNFGVILTIWDLVFGTFYYRPGIVPERIGVEHPEVYPKAENIGRVLGLPFR
jgi:sterol desaturase/sphingolipid hydroxylase (fatty acid hydroxylase superfamily)